MRIESFIWDEYNIEKCRKHGLTIAEIESFLLSTPFLSHDHKHSQNEPRYIAIGKSLGRNVFVVFTLKIFDGVLRFRVISARHARDKEVRGFYEKNKSRKT